jgi:hypothetical protein
MATLTRTLSGALARLGQTLGLRSSAGVPRYSVAARIGVVEIRHYEARLVVETLVSGAEADAQSEAVRLMARLADGAPKPANPPVAAPLAEPEAWRVMYFMAAPDGAAPPQAVQDPSIRTEVLPPQTYAVLRFNGPPTPKALAVQTRRLRRAIAGSAWRPAGEAVAWFYDPPWTLPVLRRNEVAAPLEALEEVV